MNSCQGTRAELARLQGADMSAGNRRRLGHRVLWSAEDELDARLELIDHARRYVQLDRPGRLIESIRAAARGR